MLEKFDNGELLKERQESIEALGHGGLQNASGEYLDIGGNTGKGARRVVASWKPPEPAPDAEHRDDEAEKQRRRQLLHDKAEARARFNEGQRLARCRDQRWEVTFTKKEKEVLQQWDSGQLLQQKNMSIVAVGHGRLQTAHGDYLDIGGSTGGGSRRVLDSWQPPDWREFLGDAQ